MDTTTVTQPRNLAQLRRACDEGTVVTIVNRARPQASRTTVVTRTSTVDLITRGQRDSGEVVEHSHLRWGKAGEWAFDDDGAHRVDARINGEPWLSLRVEPAGTPIDEALVV